MMIHTQDLIEYCNQLGYRILSFHAGSNYSISIDVDGKEVTRSSGSYFGLTQSVMEATNV